MDVEQLGGAMTEKNWAELFDSKMASWDGGDRHGKTNKF